MTSGILLHRLIVKAQAAENIDAVIEFQRGLNIITGPSDSGKSFVLDLLDFMLGAQRLSRDIPELTGYNYIILHISITGDEPATISISRPINGDTYEARDGHTEVVGVEGDPQFLSKTHNPKNLDNLSNFLLDKLSLAGARLRKNNRNETRTLSIRDLAHLALVDEEQMISATSPVTPTGQYTTRTVEESVFGLLIDGEDDSGLTVSAPSADEQRLSQSRVRLLDNVVAVLEDNAQLIAPIAELHDQLQRLQASIAADAESLEQRLAERDTLAARRASVMQAIDENQSTLTELSDLFNRFRLLSQQYASDLERLEMIAESGTLLALTNPDVCVLCGASTEYQDWGLHQATELDSLSSAVDAEKSKIERLVQDLNATLEDVRSRAVATRRRINGLQQDSADVTAELRRIDAELRPDRALLRELMDKRSAVERAIVVHEQVTAVDALRVRLAADEQEATTTVREKPSSGALTEFGYIMRDALQTWHVQGANPVRYDRRTRDFVIGGRARESRGKGVRALQHAAFSVALVRYCSDRNLPSPGFVVLDSPLVTYREADRDDPAQDPDATRSTSDAFYADLAQSEHVQIIVIENVPPPEKIAQSANHISFTLNAHEGRVGLFPRTISAE